MKTGREKTIKYNSSIGEADSNNASLKSHPDIHPSPSIVTLSYHATFKALDMRNKITLIFVTCNAHNLSSGPASLISLTRILENLVHFASVDTEPLQLVLVTMPPHFIIITSHHTTHRCHPLLAPTLHAGPIKITNLDTALFIRADQLSRNLSL